MLKLRELPGFARVNKVTSASLGYPPLIFNKNSTSDKKERTSSEPGAFSLHYYCIPPVCVLDVLGPLALWRRNKKNKKKREDQRKVLSSLQQREEWDPLLHCAWPFKRRLHLHLRSLRDTQSFPSPVQPYSFHREQASAPFAACRHVLSPF